MAGNYSSVHRVIGYVSGIRLFNQGAEFVTGLMIFFGCLSNLVYCSNNALNLWLVYWSFLLFVESNILSNQSTEFGTGLMIFGGCLSNFVYCSNNALNLWLVLWSFLLFVAPSISWNAISFYSFYFLLSRSDVELTWLKGWLVFLLRQQLGNFSFFSCSSVFSSVRSSGLYRFLVSSQIVHRDSYHLAHE